VTLLAGPCLNVGFGPSAKSLKRRRSRLLSPDRYEVARTRARFQLHRADYSLCNGSSDFSLSPNFFTFHPLVILYSIVFPQIDAQANLFCEVIQEVTAAAHTLFIGAVSHAVSATNVRPMICLDGQVSRS